MTPDELNALRKWVVAEANNMFPDSESHTEQQERRARVEMHRAFGFGTDPGGDASHHKWACVHCYTGHHNTTSAVGNCSCHVDKGWVAA